MIKSRIKDILYKLGYEIKRINPEDIITYKKIELNKIHHIYSFDEFYNKLISMSSCVDKVNFYDLYQYDNYNKLFIMKSDIQNSKTNNKIKIEPSNIKGSFNSIHYACGNNLIDNWLNLDFFDNNKPNYKKVDLTKTHPFEDNIVSFGFSEDFLEHLPQADSLFFLYEVFRTLRNGGVLRLSFPSLEGVLKKHYNSYCLGKIEAYTIWDHIHFYSKDELNLVAKYIGFKSFEIVEFGKSMHKQLCGLDTRADQKDLNLFVELTK